MKISEKWLREWANPAISGNEMIEQLTMAGLEVESYLPVCSGSLEKFVVGEITQTQAHPNASKLTVCQVRVDNSNAHLQIVCGASNARVGIKVVVALIDAQMLDGLVINARELRGVPSAGMLCAADEIGLAAQSEGIIELPMDAPVGMPITEYLQLSDNVIEVNITPNRGDCLSVRGLARELCALNRLPMPNPSYIDVESTLSTTSIKINNLAPEGCPTYLGRVIRGIRKNAITPIWIQERLRRSGIRSISCVVDIGNFVMLELGQPMHAFDLNKLSGEICVRWAKADELLNTLDEKEIKLSPDVLTIADDSGVIAMAGIMGGISTAISSETTDIFLECAFFTPASIMGRARRYGFQTDSSVRFERGVDPALQKIAMHRATQLITEIAGGTVEPIVAVVESTDRHSKKRTISLSISQVNRVLGTSLKRDEVVDILASLEIALKDKNNEVAVFEVPSFRFDLNIPHDLIEEVARIYGYARIKPTTPLARLKENNQVLHQEKQTQAESVLTALGFYEAITYSFVDPQWHALFFPQIQQMQLLNPISQEMSLMRNSLLPGLFQALKYNLARQQHRVRLFERGLSFQGKDNALAQTMLLSGILCGSNFPVQWGLKEQAIDFFDVKGVVEQLFASLGFSEGLRYEASSRFPFMHPGQSADIYCHHVLVGYLGMTHPGFLNKADIKPQVGFFELSLENIPEPMVTLCKEVSSFPMIKRDIAILVDKQIPAEVIIQQIRKIDSSLLQQINLFDIYEGNGVPVGLRSIAISLFVQHSKRTLTDTDVNGYMTKVLDLLQTQFEAKLRD